MIALVSLSSGIDTSSGFLLNQHTGLGMTKQGNNDVIIVKKYANRRLYNTQTSCYVTLEDLFDMIKVGDVFEVKDAKTEEDLTRSVLTQIIFEQEGKGYSLLPISFLRQLIGMYGNNMGPLVPNYLDMTMENFVQNRDRFENMTQGWQKYTPMGIFENITKKNMELFESTLRMFDPVDPEDKK